MDPSPIREHEKMTSGCVNDQETDLKMGRLSECVCVMSCVSECVYDV